MNKFILLVALCLFGAGYAFGQTTSAKLEHDFRVCGEPARDKDEGILRSDAVKSKFQRLHPCPPTGLRAGACPGWSKDHVIPLVCGGCDSVENMQWLKNTIKSCAGTDCKDRWEQKVYCSPAVATLSPVVPAE